MTLALKSQSYSNFGSLLKVLSELQLRELEFLIPSHIVSLWEAWLHDDSAYLKLCGAGGGGFFLGYAPDRSKIKLEVIWL